MGSVSGMSRIIGNYQTYQDMTSSNVEVHSHTSEFGLTITMYNNNKQGNRENVITEFEYRERNWI